MIIKNVINYIQRPILLIPGPVSTSNKVKKAMAVDIASRQHDFINTIDSINYSIIRRWKDDKTPILESITNNLTKIDSWKEYHENGQLRAQGFMTTSNHTYIGKWNYYSEKGLLDSIVDYDKRYKVAFCDFYEIAKTKGLTGKTVQ